MKFLSFLRVFLQLEMLYMCLRENKQKLLGFLLLDRNYLGEFCKIIVLFDKLWCYLLNLVLVVVFLIGFSNQKTLFFDILCFFCIGFAIRRCAYSNMWNPIYILDNIS